MLKSDLFKYSNHLGFFNPYYFVNNEGKFVFGETFNEILEVYKSQNTEIEIDTASIAMILNKHYILGDRTLVKNIFRSPWMAYPNNDKTEWIYHKLPKHDNLILSENLIADKLFYLLCDEILDYVGNKDRIGILLSGGMDSRIVAGILDFLIKEKKIKAKKVVAYTWGNDNCRDVVYAKQISQRLDWEWKHFVVEHDDIKKNFKISAEQGCEYSGIHLHGIPKIALEQEVDLILAGSYGDSIGRAEYSGKHVKHIKPLNFLFYNFGSLLNYKCYKNVSSEVKSEIGKYHKLFPREKKYQQLELDYQLHYMRRMLNPCMAVINQKTPLFQVFTSPEVFGFMWSLNPEMRNNNIYTHLMEKFKTKLNDIPWSRTGKMFNSKIGVSDNYEKKTNSYSEIIQKDIVEKFSNTEISNGIINKHSFKKLLLSIQKANNYNFHYLEAICWVNSFSIFFRINNFKIFNRQINTIDLLLSFRAKLIYFIERLVWKTYIERIKK